MPTTKSLSEKRRCQSRELCDSRSTADCDMGDCSGKFTNYSFSESRFAADLREISLQKLDESAPPIEAATRTAVGGQACRQAKQTLTNPMYTIGDTMDCDPCVNKKCKSPFCVTIESTLVIRSRRRVYLVRQPRSHFANCPIITASLKIQLNPSVLKRER